MIEMLCPKCNTPMRYTAGQKDKIVMTMEGMKEWTFNGFYSCKSGKCRFVIEDIKNNFGGEKMWKQFKKKPVIVKAIQFTYETKDIVYNDVKQVQQNIQPSTNKQGSPCFIIPTLEGEMRANIGDWIIQGVKGELYPCKPDIFEQTYSEVNNGQK